MSVEVKVKDGKKKERGWYIQIGLSETTHAKLVRVKESKSKQIGIALSWNEFFTLVMGDLEAIIEKSRK